MAYAKTRISINGRATSILFPYHDINATATIPRTTAIGSLPPQQSSVIALHPDNAWQPFVLLGASIVAEEAVGLSGLEYAAFVVDDRTRTLLQQ